MRYTLLTECNSYDKVSKFENLKGNLINNQLTFALTSREISCPDKTIKAGKALITNGEKFWLITDFSFKDKRPKNSIATIEGIHHEANS